MDVIKSIAIQPTRRRDNKRRPFVASNLAARGTVADDSEMPRGDLPPAASTPRHLYQVGQHLRMQGGGNRWARPDSLCEVIALLPRENGPLLYRVRSEVENYERVVAEADLSPAA